MDPLTEQFVGWTPYHYVHNNPINLIDPTGMSAEGPGDGWWSKITNGVKSLFSSSNKQEASPIEDTVLDDVVVYANKKQNWFQKNFSRDKLSNDWQNIKENTGINHASKWINNFKNKYQNGIAFSKDGGSNLKDPSGGRDVRYMNIEWLLDIIGALKVGAPTTVPGVGDVHTPTTFGKQGKDTEVNNNSSNSINDPNIVEVERKIYWQDDMWKESPVRGHNAHKIKVYKNQVDSVKNANRKDSIKATKLRR